MRTTIFCFIFLVFSFLFAKVDVHPPENPIVPPGWSEDFSQMFLPSRCGGIYINSAHKPYDWSSNSLYPYHLDSIDPLRNLHYYCNGIDPIENFPNERNIHYQKELYKKTAFYYSKQYLDIEFFNQDKIFESNLLKSIGFNFENILLNDKKEIYINGSKCDIYNIESEMVLTKFYFFKRKRYTLLYSAWSENKDYFYQNIPLIDSTVNTVIINSL